MKIGIIREYKTPADKRVVFSPRKCIQVINQYPTIDLFIEKSDIRCFADKEYSDLGLNLVSDLSNCDILIGVKEVPIEKLIKNKKYFFFSHTIKKQPYNKKLLQEILKSNIELHDHETITDRNGNRLIGFGHFAGVVGVYNGLRAYGLKSKRFNIPKAIDLKDRYEFNRTLKSISIPNIKILLSGKGRVGKGALDVLNFLKIKEVSAEDFVKNSFNVPVFSNIDVLDYNFSEIIENTQANFYNFPEKFISSFSKFSSVTDLYFAGHYHNPNAPKLISLDDLQKNSFNIKVIADISCDINGPIASTIRPSTINNPIYGFNKKTLVECDHLDKDAISVMAVDNLPCELPRDSSEMFGDMFFEHVLPSFFNNDKNDILKNSLITSNGNLTKRYKYLADFISS